MIPKIPKIVYMFWKGTMNSFVHICMQKLKTLNPTWDVRILSSADVVATQGLEGLSNTAHVADWVRVDQMSRTGGVWMDATCMSMLPLESWVDVYSDKMQGFACPLDIDIDVMEGWAFATPPGHKVMALWKAELQQAIEIGFDNYKKKVSDLPVSKLQMYKHMPYLTMNGSLYNVMSQHDPHYETIEMRPSIGSESAPFQYLHNHSWNSNMAVRWLCSHPFDLVEHSNIPPFYKLRGVERSIVINWMSCGMVEPDSIMDVFFAGQQDVSMYFDKCSLSFHATNYVMNTHKDVLLPPVVVVLVLFFSWWLFAKRRGMKRRGSQITRRWARR